MGNLTSKQKTDETVFNNFYEVIDYIASYYILKADFKSLKKLNNPEYCNKLVMITTDVIKKAFNTRDIQFIAKRIQDGLEVNEMKDTNYTYMTHDQLDSLDIKNTQTGNVKKDDICVGISEFYIKIANVFASIVMTINPVFSYKENGVDAVVGLSGREKIPAGVSVNMNKFSFCDNRISALERGKTTLGDRTTLNPKICDINLDANGNVKNLTNEPGLLNLENLYLDSKFDYTTGTFTERSKDSQEQYMKDLRTFYKSFHDEDLPPGVDSFAQVILRDYNQKDDCKPENGELLKKTIEVPNKDDLFVKYAKHLKDMTTRASNNHKYLLEIINDLFSKKESSEGKNLIRINPKLNDAKLDAIIIQTRILIVRMYAQCELDYLEGVKLYEAIVHSTIYKISEKQLQYFENEAAMMMVEQFGDDTPENMEGQQEGQTGYPSQNFPSLAPGSQFDANMQQQQNPGESGMYGQDGNTGELGMPGQDGNTGELGMPGQDGNTGGPGMPGQDGNTGGPGMPGQDGNTGGPGMPGQDQQQPYGQDQQQQQPYGQEQPQPYGQDQQQQQPYGQQQPQPYGQDQQQQQPQGPENQYGQSTGFENQNQNIPQQAEPGISSPQAYDQVSQQPGDQQYGQQPPIGEQTYGYQQINNNMDNQTLGQPPAQQPPLAPIQQPPLAPIQQPPLAQPPIQQPVRQPPYAQPLVQPNRY
jgi:hypothetical protein